MENTLLNIGIACIISAIVGGGLKGFGIEFPLFNLKRQIILGVFGVILVIVYFFMNNTTNLPNLSYGTWTLHNAIDDNGKNWSDSTLKFTSQQKTSDGLLLHGTFTWRLDYNLIGTEEFSGHYIDKNRQIILEGVSVSDANPSATYKLALGSYSAVVSPDERELVEGRWGSTMTNDPGVGGKWSATR